MRPTHDKSSTTHDDAAAGGFVVWILAYAILMIALFAFRDGSVLSAAPFPVELAS